MIQESLLIKVPEQEFKHLLDRDKVVEDIRAHFKPWTDLLRDLVNYGSNLVPRCFGSSERGLKDMVVLATLLPQAVAMLDGVDILLSNGSVHAANLQMRALFEASVYIDFILLNESERKASYYYVHNLRRKRMWALRTQLGSDESKDFLEMMEKEGVKVSDEVRETARQQIQKIDRILSQAKFAHINDDIQKARRGKKFDPAWYAPLGQRSLRTVAHAVGKSSQYVIFYSGASEVTHTSSYERHMKIGNGELTFEPVRSLEGFESVFRPSVIFALSTFRRVLQEYRPGELPLFSRKYAEKWKNEFINFPKITVKAETTRI
jgi:hypothetical protein